MTGFTPTAEQECVIDLFTSGENVSITAGAGTGKTTTLEAVARSTRRSGRYLAFNRAIVNDAGRRMPQSCAAQTIHQAAMGAIGHRYRHRLDAPRQSSETIARRLGIAPLNLRVDTAAGPLNKVLTSGTLASIAMQAVNEFCKTADPEPTVWHIGFIDGIDLPTEDGRRTYTNNNIVRAHLADALGAIWADACDPNGTLRYSHDRYLKLWELSEPTIGADYLMCDEAQDVSPVMLSIFLQQQHAQLVFVGDPQQAIYGWLGNIDAMGELPDAFSAVLSKSFRFGPEIARVANGILDTLGADLRLTGHDPIQSTIGKLSNPSAVLCRSNAHAIETVMTHLDKGRSVYLVGEGREVIPFARAALKLQAGQSTDYPELACFGTWGEVQEYVAVDAQGGELRLLVELIDKFGAQVIIDALEHMPKDENDADIIVSTAHKAKGREWDRVQLGDDFPEPDEDGWPAEELRLLYVAATRGRLQLDPGNVPYFHTPKFQRRVKLP